MLLRKSAAESINKQQICLKRQPPIAQFIKPTVKFATSKVGSKLAFCLWRARFCEEVKDIMSLDPGCETSTFLSSAVLLD